MATSKLTELAVRASKPTGASYKITDGEGLYLQVKANGSRLWQMAYRFDGKQKTLSFGPYPRVSLSAARAQRQGAKERLRDGSDPGVKPNQLRAEPEAVLMKSFQEIAARWFETRKHAWTPAHADRVWSRVEKDLLNPLGSRQIIDVTGADILAALRTIESRKAIETARRVRGYAEDIFRFAKAEGLVVTNPALELVHALTSPPPQKHRAALRERDLPSFLTKVNSYQGEPLTRAALMLVMLTFVRSSELRSPGGRSLRGSMARRPFGEFQPNA